MSRPLKKDDRVMFSNGQTAITYGRFVAEDGQWAVVEEDSDGRWEDQNAYDGWPWACIFHEDGEEIEYP